MKKGYVRVILNDDVTEKVFRDFSKKNGFRVVGTFERTPNSAFQIVTESDDGDQVKFSDDQILSARYLEVLASEPSEIVSEVQHSLSYFGDDFVLKCAEDDDEKPLGKALWLANATALQEQAGRRRLASLIAKRLKDDAAEVRRAAVVCVGWLEWPQLIKKLVPLRNDADPTVASYARAFLEVSDRAAADPD